MVASGIESAQALVGVRRQHCDLVQGFHVGWPLPAAEFERACRAGWGAG